MAAPKRRLNPEPLVWEDPPGDNRGHAKNHYDIAETLRANPGVWAMVGTYATTLSASSMAHHIRMGKTMAYAPAGMFESRARTVGDEHRVYVRYVGDDQ